jgi:hypothetical protein
MHTFIAGFDEAGPLIALFPQLCFMRLAMLAFAARYTQVLHLCANYSSV